MAGKGKSKIGCTFGGCYFAAVIIIFVTSLTVSFLGGTGESLADTSTSIASVDGDVEFWFTTYDPAKGGTNGHDCGGAAIKVCSDSNSPTGYVGKYNGSVVSNGVIAVPQDAVYDRNGKVSLDEIPVPLIHSKVLEQAKIIIPGYNNSEAVPVGDHFASTITKPNRIDLACKNYCPDMVAYMKANNLILESASGLNGGSKVLGKIVGEVIR